jgi:hypothetical protein
MRSLTRGTLIALAMAIAYVLLPNSQHLLLAGVPLSLLSAAAVIVIVACAYLSREAAGRRGVVWGLAALVILKGVFALALPARGFDAEYFMNAAFLGTPFRYVDARLAFDAETFRREYVIDARFRGMDRHEELWPFSVHWSGAFAVAAPTPLTVLTQASEPVTVTIDGMPAARVAQPGSHTIAVVFARRTETPPAVRVELPGITVFTRPIGVVTARIASVYRLLSVVMDGVLLLGLVGLTLRGTAGALQRARPLRWVPPFPLAGLGVMAFWFAVGAVRTAPRWDMMEFLNPGDDWQHYKAWARVIASGDIGNGTYITSIGSFAYPYFLAALQIVFGERHWPLYFAQHLLLGVACLFFGLLGRRIFGEGRGVFVLVAVTTVAALDVSRWYVVQFLSENLAILAVPIAFLALHAYLVRPTPSSALAAGAMLGALGLVRVSLLPFAGIAMVALLVMGITEDLRARSGWTSRIVLAAAFVATYGLFPLRDYLAAGTLNLYSASAGTNYWYHESFFLPRLRVSWVEALRSVVLPNMAFIGGYPRLLAYPPDTVHYAVRFHWILLWLGYVMYVAAYRRKRVTATEGAVHLFVAIYLGLIVTQPIWSYGFRYVLPLPLVVSLFLPEAVAAVTAVSRTLTASSARMKRRTVP